MPRKLTRDEAVQAFWNKVDKRGPNECWPWLAAIVAHGYGAFRFNGRFVLAHRLAYELLIGPIPVGLHIDHLCRNRSCQNPQHMEAVTNRVNTLRGIGCTATNARKTACKRGHHLDETNTYVRPNGYRMCRVCRREKAY